jgi:uncharacterized membrane protein (UPF0182 family)
MDYHQRVRPLLYAPLRRATGEFLPDPPVPWPNRGGQPAIMLYSTEDVARAVPAFGFRERHLHRECSLALHRLPQGHARWQRTIRIIAAVIVLILVLFGYQAVKIYTDWLWFGELRQSAVFARMIGVRLTLFFGMGLLFYLFSHLNFWIAWRLNESRPRLRGLDPDREQISRIARSVLKRMVWIAPIVLALPMGASAAGQWAQYLQFTHGVAVGTRDPVFNLDIGFYLFRLPFLNFLVTWSLAAVALTAAGVAVLHYSSGALDFLATNLPTYAPYVRRHLLALAGCFAAIYAGQYWLGRYDLLTADNGFFTGGGYTDLHVRLPVTYWQMATALLVAAACFVNIRIGRPFLLPLISLGLWVLVSVVGAGALPSLVQRFVVVPNQFDKEREYISRNLSFTRTAYALDHVKEEPFAASSALTAADLAADRPTIENIRLWDWPQLGLVYTAKQALATYYRFTLPPNATMTSGDYNIDVDRYAIHGRMRQVMVGVRELYTPGLPETARTWQNERLQYTHGYGIVMSPVNQIDPQGLPEYYISEIPIRSQLPNLQITRPQIYYGELTTDYVFVNTRQDEFDYHSGSGDVTTRYSGKGGVQLGSDLVRLAWSIRLGDTNMLLSSDLTPQSRILFRRAIRERVQALAPFLNWDNDPYIVLYNGRLVWIMDGYTVTDRYPYSRPFAVGAGEEGTSQQFNYIRNSVKAVVDAYDGTVQFFVADPNDALIRTWMRIFPTLFTPLAQMDPTLRAHVRYPEDLFRIQRSIFTLYHITDPRIYYNKEDAWEVPADPTPPSANQTESPDADSQSLMQPYYVVMRLPGAQSEEFLMITPFTPLRRQNLSAWMCARCDPDHYGELLVYRFPRGLNVNGPQQIIGQIKQQREISETMTLLGQVGSRVVFGNLLVIPVDTSLLYAVPLYVQAAAQGAAAIPQIQRVIVATGDKIVMDTTLDAAIADLGKGSETPSTAQTSPAATATVKLSPPGRRPPLNTEEALRQAQQAYAAARKHEQEYGKALDELGQALQQLKQSLRSQGSPSGAAP